MKKIILSVLMLFALVFSAQSQNISKNAIGLRLATMMVLAARFRIKEV